MYKFKDGNAIMAMGSGGTGYCGNGYINLEIPIEELCPNDWVKVTWHRNTSCDNNTNFGCAKGQVLWKIKGITDYSTNACGGLPITSGTTGNYGPVNQQNICNINTKADCKEIYIKPAMVRDLEITAEAVDCGIPPFGCNLTAFKTYVTGFWYDPILNQPYPDPTISISGDATLPCQGQNSVYTLNGITHYSSSLPLTITWTLTNSNWTIVSGQNSSAVTINTNGNPGNAVLRARIDTYDPFDCNRTYYIEEFSIGRDLSNIANVTNINWDETIVQPNNDYCQNSSDNMWINSPAPDPTFESYEWRISSPFGTSRLNRIGNPNEVTNLVVSSNSANSNWASIRYKMEDYVTVEAKYNYSCGSSPWYSESRFTKKLPLIPGPIDNNSGVSLCSPNALEFEVNSLSLYTDNFNWTAGPGSIIYQTKNSRNKTIEFNSGAVPTSNQILNLSVTGSNICGSGPTRTTSFDFNQPAQKPILEIPDCWKRGNTSGSTPNEIVITNPEVGVDYIWEVVPHENGSAFIPAWVLNSSKTISDVGFFNRAVDRLYIKVTADGCIGIDPFELKDFDPIDVPDNMECAGGSEGRRGKNLEVSATKIYPNPATKTLNLRFERNELRKISVFDLNGKKIDEFQVYGTFKAYDISKFQSGSYIIQVEGNDLIETHKFGVL